MSKRVDILGIGNPLIDYFCRVDAAFLEQFELQPGRPHHIPMQKSLKILQAAAAYSDSITAEPGGCVFNSLRTASALGMSCAFAGGIGNDDIYIREAAAYGMDLLVDPAETPSGICIYLVCNEIETLVVSTGAASCGLQKLNSTLPEAEWLMIESFVFGSDEIISNLRSFDSYKKLFLDLGSPRAVDIYTDEILFMIEKSTGIISGTEAEFQAFEQVLAEYSLTLDEILKSFIFLYKDGKNGAKIVSFETDSGYIKGTSENAVCTAGAGDNLAAGFLFALKQGYDYSKCIEAGNKAGQLCVKRPLGRLLPEDIKEIEEVCNDSVIK